ncbi:MAG: hypothetical protein QOI10_3484 [Solirubrobacterales bacterium]|jgi:hypothetical protein|nr:hypothetical protein [Solirubrobacterales bacterium]
MNRQQILERERRRQTLAGYAAVAAAPLYVISLAILRNTGVPLTGLATEQLRAVNDASGQVLIASVLSAASLALVMLPLLYLFRATEARSSRVNPAMIGFIFIGPSLFAVQTLIKGLAQVQLASDFASSSGRSGDIYTLLDDLVNDSTLNTIGSYLILPALLAFVVAMVYVPLNAMRVGLLTRFFATLGMALGVSLVLIQPQLSLLALIIWFAWLGFTILDKSPRGRPAAWDAGEAIPWPKPGEQPRPAVAGDAVLDGDATEVFSEPAAPADRTARRERAKKRKRKRRR